MRIQKLTVLLCLLGSLLGGCQLPQWQPGGGTHTVGDGTFSVNVPPDWMYLEGRAGHLVATNDGLYLQRINMERTELKEPLSYSKRVLTANLTPLELAEAVADDLRADHAMMGLEVVENTPAELDGHPGFKLVITYHTEGNLRVSEAIVGAIVGENLYVLVYAGPTRYYFDRDRARFDEVVKSFRVTAK